ncbi:unnamed protein product [Linum tenue]|uniref:Basic blue protein n=1 Tax=Linum tenue TaxID=586396 RepID=A0AAV0GRR9_9ROSI|nr:unnamed protein product [Linum tenue]
MGRGGLGVGGLLLIMLIVINMEVNESTTYEVGDEFGWDPTIDMETWPRGKTFHAGDILEFKYDDQKYDVVVTDQVGHDTCTVTPRSEVHNSGYDRIELQHGGNYFICSISSLCSAGLKMAVSADF